jgi:hypothetical protein
MIGGDVDAFPATNLQRWKMSMGSAARGFDRGCAAYFVCQEWMGGLRHE